MKEYGSIPRLLDDGTLKGEQVVAFNKLDGQNFRVKYMAKGHDKKQFTLFGSRHQLVDDSTENFNNAIRYFREHCEEPVRDIIVNNSGKKGIFNGVDEITCFFEWYGDNSFAGFHQEGDNLRLALIDVFLKKKGYMEPEKYYDLFKMSGVEIPSLIYRGALDSTIINLIQTNDWTQPDCAMPHVKEGVVFKRSTLLKGQRRPSVKVKTKWWIEKLHSMYTEEECKILE